MKIRTRVFLGILIVIAVGFFVLLFWIVEDLEPQYRKATEEPLVDSARILASIAAGTVSDGGINVKLFRTIFEDIYTQSFSAPIYDFVKKDVDFRVYITDTTGMVLFDSHDRRNEGKNFSQWLDVMRTLQGEYGARTSRDRQDDPLPRRGRDLPAADLAALEHLRPVERGVAPIDLLDGESGHAVFAVAMEIPPSSQLWTCLPQSCIKYCLGGNDSRLE